MSPEDPLPFIVLAAVGEILWVVAYLQIIRAGFRDRTYGVPMVCVCLNIGWEFHLSWICPLFSPELCPNSATPGLWVWRAWFFGNAVILWQLWRYGRGEELIPALRSYFRPIVAGLIVVAYTGHVTFIAFFGDLNGAIAAWMINFVMAVLFLHLLAARPGLEGLSHAAAWTKMIANVLISLGFLGAGAFADRGSPAFIYSIWVGTLIFDCAYIALLRRRRARLASV